MGEANARTNEDHLFDPMKGHVHFGAPWPVALADYKALPTILKMDVNGQRWYRQLHKTEGEDAVFVIRDFTEVRGLPMSYMQGPFDVFDAYTIAPSLFPPCFQPIAPEEEE